MEVVVVIVVCLVLLTAKGFYDRKVAARKLREKVVNSYGAPADKNFNPYRAMTVALYRGSRPASDCYIDDITWNDLDMDRIYYLLNSCKSSIGDEYLFYLLHNPISDIGQLKERNRVIEALMSDEELRTEVGVFAANLGNAGDISVYDYISKLKNAETDSNLKHILSALLLVASIGLFFAVPVAAVLITIGVFALNIATYFKRKSEIDCYFIIFAYILRMIGDADCIAAVRAADKEGVLSRYTDAITDAANELRKITKGAAMFVNPVGSGDILQSLLDYVRMAFHIDLIKFNNIVRKFVGRQEEFDRLFENIGFLDCMLAVASYREWAGDTTLPNLTDDRENGLKLKVGDIAHPLLEEPVTNSLETSGPILLTGSNASGKSTFLKTIAINAVLAQTVYTVRAAEYTANCFRVMSSIALRDDLESGESYYIVEIKSLKRILDEVDKENAMPTLCFIDEVLRGTNTIERISASTEILKKLASGNAICIAATHDIELTYLLENVYDNYHFEEKVDDNSVEFDYTLRDGRATTRNAIRLLGLMGFDGDIVEAAAKRADAMAKKSSEN